MCRVRERRCAAAGLRAFRPAIRSVTCVGMACPMVSHTTISSAPVVRGSAAMPITRSGSVRPSNGHVNAVAMHSWIEPPTSCAIRTASGIAATLSSVLRPMLALLWESDAEKQYWKFRAPAAAAFSTCRGVATQIQQRSSSSASRAAMMSSVSASGGTRSGRAIEPTSSAGTPSASNSRTICTLRSVGSIFAVSCSPSRRVTSRRSARGVYGRGVMTVLLSRHR